MVEIINRDVYIDIRNQLRTEVMNWNGINRVWYDTSPDYKRWVSGWKGSKVQMYDTIPESNRNKKYISYEGNSDSNKVNETIPESTSIIHTIENENNIRRTIQDLISKFKNKLIFRSSYQVYPIDIIEETIINDVVTTKTIGSYYSPIIQNLPEKHLFEDENCTKYVDTVPNIEVISSGDIQVSRKILITSDEYKTINDYDLMLYIKNIGTTGSFNKTPPIGTSLSTTSYVVQDGDDYELDNVLIPPEDIITNDYSTLTKLENNNDIVTNEDYEQINIILEKIVEYINTKNSWFDSSNLCKRSCQIKCQSTCQLNCQACNTKQCHDQRCGTH